MSSERGPCIEQWFIHVQVFLLGPNALNTRARDFHRQYVTQHVGDSRLCFIDAVVDVCFASCVQPYQTVVRSSLHCAAGMGRSLTVLVFSFCFALQSARAGTHDTFEPYQVLDIRMEEGMKDAAATQHIADSTKGTLDGAAFLASREGRGVDRLASIVATQKAESARLLNILAR